MRHLEASSRISGLKFCPFEDVLGMGHSKGISSLIVPGSGEANYDTMEVNPYETKKQRRENEVHRLMEKIQPEMIMLNPNFVGQIDLAPADVLKEEQRREWEVCFFWN
jgi:U3 small nucleolar RNA-associated protein 7